MTDDAIRLDAHKDEFHRDQQWHKPVRVASTADVTISTALNSGDSIDGVTLATGDRVLLKDQSPGSENGIYVVRASPGRAYDMLTGQQTMGSFVYVITGGTSGGKVYRNTNTSVPTVGSTTLTFAEWVSGGGGLDVGIALYLDHGAAGATETIDQSVAMAHRIELDDDMALTFSGAVATVDGDDVECSFRLYVDTDGSFTVTWPGSVVWATSAPDLTTAAVYVIDFTTPDGGTTWYGYPGASAAVALSDATPLIESGAGDAGVGTLASRDDHVHPEFGATVTAAQLEALGVVGAILISDDHSTPIVFADILLTEAGDDILYADLGG